MNITQEQLKSVAEKLNTGYVSHEKLSTGAHNLNIKLTTTDGEYVVRIAIPTRLEDLEKEHRFLRDLNGRFGPKALLFDESKTIIDQPYLVQEYIVGEHPTKADNEFSERMAQWYQDLHAVGCPPVVPHADTKGRYSLTHFFDEMILSRYTPNKDCVPQEWQERIDNLFLRIQSVATEHDQILKQARCAIVHWDPNLRNIFYTKEGIKVVDWEFVSFDAPEWDLVAFLWAHDLHGTEERHFLDAYGYNGDEQTLTVLMTLFVGLILAWRIKRLHLIRQGSVPDGFKHGEEQELIEQFSWLTEDLEELLTTL